ncbi:MAG: Crp/Fnr family transcriptional regulator [Proteobacteria bacterium]|nr:Crp/Fnr family transcriptional regulator [Pseudomonadota bacterium]
MLQRLLFNTAQPVPIKDMPLFAGLAESERDSLLKEGRFCSCPRKKILFRQGDPVTHFYVVCSGTVRLFHETPDGCEITTDIFTVGDTICEMEIFQFCNAHFSHAEAVHDVVLIEFPKLWLEEKIQQHKMILRNMLTVLARRTILREAEVERQATMSALQLVACFLQHMVVAHDLDARGFELPYSKSLIATRLGMELETFSRSWSKLRGIGIAVKGKNVQINNPSAVEQHVCGRCSFMEHCRV